MDPIGAKALAAVATAKENVAAIYKDLFQPPLQKMGKALGNIMDLGTITTSWIPFVNDKMQIYFADNLSKYKKRLESIPEDQIISVPPEIAAPLLKRFEYIANEELQELFVNLLVSASSSETAMTSHPAFISVLDRLSPDEARILKYLKNEHRIPSITIDKVLRPNSNTPNLHKTTQFVCDKATSLAKEVKMRYPDNDSLYIENLTSLGLIEHQDKAWAPEKIDNYILLEEEWRGKSVILKLPDESDEDHQRSLEVKKGMYHRNHFCVLFLEACVKD